MLPCKDCITLAICKAIIQNILQPPHIIELDETDIFPPNSGAGEVIDRLVDRCTLLFDYIYIQSSDKIQIIGKSKKSIKRNEFAIQQVLNYFNLESLPLPVNMEIETIQLTAKNRQLLPNWTHQTFQLPTTPSNTNNVTLGGIILSS